VTSDPYSELRALWTDPADVPERDAYLEAYDVAEAIARVRAELSTHRRHSIHYSRKAKPRGPKPQTEQEAA
jgi:hypothetical protein